MCLAALAKIARAWPQVFNDVHKYNPKTNSWVKLMSHRADGHGGSMWLLYTTARLMLLAVLTRISSMAILKIQRRLEKIQPTIDKINAHYFDKKQKIISSISFCCLWSSTQQWSYAGESPRYGTAGAAVVNKGDKTSVINGEAKPDCERMPYLNLISPVII